VTTLHVLAVVAGALVALGTTVNFLRTLVIPRSGLSPITRTVDAVVDAVFKVISAPLHDYKRKDRVLAAQGPLFLVAQLFAWLLAYEIAFTLVLWPSVSGLGAAAREAASSMFTLGFVSTRGATPTVVDVLAAVTGLVVITMQIAYLPTLYSAFNRRETDVTLLEMRAGTPPWGPELLARTRYGVRARTDDLPEFYAQWERWAADVAESHSNYPVLVRFRSPHPLSSWLVSLLAVMDSAAMLLALAPSRERMEPRLAVRMGFVALRQIATAVGIPVDADPDPDSDIQLPFEDFSAAVDRLIAVGFPVERTAEEAWPHFRGWRVNYEPLAYSLAWRTDAVPAPWSGPRRWPHNTIYVRRPPNRLPGGGTGVLLAPPDPAVEEGSAPGQVQAESE
jgi:hypothetical protein